MDYEIIHQPEQHLFKTEVDGRTAFVQYRLLGDSLDIIHTIVPRPIEGRRPRNSRRTGKSCLCLCSSQRNETESHLLLCGEMAGTPSGVRLNHCPDGVNRIVCVY